MLTFGFEGEFFCKRGEEFVLAKPLPADAGGLLAEARGREHEVPEVAAKLFEIKTRELFRQAEKEGIFLTSATPQKLPASLVRSALREYGKGQQKDRSLSGRWLPSSLSHAGLHVHIGNVLKHTCSKTGCGAMSSHSLIFDVAQIVLALDKEFGAAIRAAKRVPGLYEMKWHGFEYRSLPASIDPYAVASFIESKDRFRSAL